MTVLTDKTFENFTSNNDCLVLIFKKLCPYCRVLMTVLEKCLVKYPELNITGVDSEENPSVLSDNDVSKVPTVLVYKGGKLAAC